MIEWVEFEVVEKWKCLNISGLCIGDINLNDFGELSLLVFEVLLIEFIEG